MKSFNGRAEKECDWVDKNRSVISSVARFSGINPVRVGSMLARRISGGRTPVYHDGELLGYSDGPCTLIERIDKALEEIHPMRKATTEHRDLLMELGIYSDRIPARAPTASEYYRDLLKKKREELIN